MKINILSDLHSEFWPDSGCPFEIPSGEALVLAGDICKASDLAPHIRKKNVVEFFEKCCDNFDIVFYVMGNHESYGMNIRHSEGIILDFSNQFCNIFPLADTWFVYKGVQFIGGTLWTDLNKSDPLTVWDAGRTMNDYNQIDFRGRSLSPQDTLDFHSMTLKNIKFYLESDYHKYKKNVILTHHAPSRLSLNSRYKNEYHANGNYCSDLDYLFYDHPEIKLWVHGHMHSSSDYNIHESKVICNPYGYYGHALNKSFDPNKSFEV